MPGRVRRLAEQEAVTCRVGETNFPDERGLKLARLSVRTLDASLLSGETNFPDESRAFGGNGGHLGPPM